jgi:hypothetical protein
MDIKNNIIVGYSSSIETGEGGELIDEDYNCCYGYTTAAATGFDLGANSITTDPDLTNFVPASDSPAVGAAVALASTYKSLIDAGSSWPEDIDLTLDTALTMGAFNAE